MTRAIPEPGYVRAAKRLHANIMSGVEAADVLSDDKYACLTCHGTGYIEVGVGCNRCNTTGLISLAHFDPPRAAPSVEATTAPPAAVTSVPASREHDAVNHPKHYKVLGAKCSGCGKDIECIDVTQHMNFTKGNAVKYIWRAGEKDPARTIEDIEKSIWYLQCEIRRLEKDLK